MPKQKEILKGLNEEVLRLRNLLAEQEVTLQNERTSYKRNLATLQKKVDEKQLQNNFLINRLEAINLICSSSKFLDSFVTTGTGSSSSSTSTLAVESNFSSSAHMSLIDGSEENDEEGNDNLIECPQVQALSEHASVSTTKSVIAGVSSQNQNTDRISVAAGAEITLTRKRKRKRKTKAEMEVEVEDLGEDVSADKKKSVVWNSELDVLLTAAVNKYGDKNISGIAKFVGNKVTREQCMTRWKDVLQPHLASTNGGIFSNRKTGKFCKEEDALLLAYVAENSGKGKGGTILWSTVSSVIEGRTEKDCGHRWSLLSEKGRKRGKWTAAEDEALCRLKLEWESSHEPGKVLGLWKFIGDTLDRPPSACRCRWRHREGLTSSSRPSSTSKPKPGNERSAAVDAQDDDDEEEEEEEEVEEEEDDEEKDCSEAHETEDEIDLNN